MTRSLPSRASLAILLADHKGKITSEESASPHAMEKETKPNLPPCWVTEIPPSFSPSKTHGWEESLDLASGHEFTFSPNFLLTGKESIFPFYWRLSLELLAFELWAARLEFINT